MDIRLNPKVVMCDNMKLSFCCHSSTGLSSNFNCFCLFFIETPAFPQRRWMQKWKVVGLLS